MTILPKKKSLSVKEVKQGGPVSPASPSGANSSSDYLGSGAEVGVSSITLGSQTTTASGGGAGDSLVPTASANVRRAEMNLECDVNSLTRKRQAPAPISRTDRSLMRNKQRNSGHVLPTTSTAAANSADGYNSEDEAADGDEHPVEDAEVERQFESSLKAAKGFIIKKMRADGACMFRAVADQVYGDQEMHSNVRSLCISYMKKNSDYFSQFVTENFNNYLTRKSQETAHGNHVELQAMAEMYSRPIEVYQYNTTPMNTFFSDSSAGMAPIRLSYHSSSHYNSVVDPYNATIGVGLGMPELYPGMADRNLMRDASMISERDVIEDAMLKDKLLATDWEATDAQLQDQVACESYLQWLADEKKRREQNKSSSDGANSSNAQTSHPSSSSDNRSPDKEIPIDPWASEEDLLSHVLALSSQEYLDALKKDSQKKQEDKCEEAACCSKTHRDQACSSSFPSND